MLLRSMLCRSLVASSRPSRGEALPLSWYRPHALSILNVRARSPGVYTEAFVIDSVTKMIFYSLYLQDFPCLLDASALDKGKNKIVQRIDLSMHLSAEVGQSLQTSRILGFDQSACDIVLPRSAVVLLTAPLELLQGP